MYVQVPPDQVTVQESELLPVGWNCEDGVYSLLYRDVKCHATHLLKIVSCDEDLMVHFVVVVFLLG